MTRKQHPAIKVLLIDLDDTLYESSEMSNLVAEKIRNYMVTKLGFSLSQVEESCRDLYLNYGTTLAGLVASGYSIDFDDWHAEVHGTLPYHKFLKPDPRLKAMLDAIPIPKYIFTNADKKHADICLDILGITNCFDGIICFESIMAAAKDKGLVHHNKPVICKPNRQAFELALAQVDVDAHISSTAFFDDSTRNITSSHRLGIFSVLVGRVGIDCPSDIQMRSIHDFADHLPWLISPAWDRKFLTDIESKSGTVEVDEESQQAALTVQA